MKTPGMEYHEAVDEIKNDLGNVRNDLRSLFASAQEVLKKGSGASIEKIDEVSKSFQKSVGERPFTTIGITLAAGFFIGRFLRK